MLRISPSNRFDLLGEIGTAYAVGFLTAIAPSLSLAILFVKDYLFPILIFRAILYLAALDVALKAGEIAKEWLETIAIQ